MAVTIFGGVFPRLPVPVCCVALQRVEVQEFLGLCILTQNANKTFWVVDATVAFKLVVMAVTSVEILAQLFGINHELGHELQS